MDRAVAAAGCAARGRLIRTEKQGLSFPRRRAEAGTHATASTTISTEGSRIADTVNDTATPVEFANIDPSYSSFFETFSPQRLFTALGSNILDVLFFIPGTTTAAVTTGFGAVFTDVDLANTTSLQFFDSSNMSLGTFFAPNIAGNETLSFLGVSFDSAIVSRVGITSGNQILAAGNTATDLVTFAGMTTLVPSGRHLRGDDGCSFSRLPPPAPKACAPPA